jgi:hypothetical protein
MRVKYRYRMPQLLLAAVLTAGWLAAGNVRESPAAGWPAPGGRPAAAGMSTKESDEYKEFLKRVQDYVRLHKSIEATLPALKPTDLPELITAHQQALARKIREARPNAKPGDIFTEDAIGAFRKVIHHELRGPGGHRARKTIQQGEPLKMQVEINQPYPDGVPYTTLPPSLLLKFPKLPPEMAYRIVGHDLILLDVNASLVVDLVKDLIP